MALSPAALAKAAGPEEGYSAYADEQSGYSALKRSAFDEAYADYARALVVIGTADYGVTNNPRYGVALYGRGLAQRGRGDTTHAEMDLAAAERAYPRVAAKFDALGGAVR